MASATRTGGLPLTGWPEAGGWSSSVTLGAT